MNKELKIAIKTEIKKIIDEIEIEENEFNHMFHSNIEFQKSYYKFLKIYEKYGKEAYLKYVPLKYKKQEIKSLIYEQNYLQMYEHYGIETINKLMYSQNICKKELQINSKFKILFLKLKKIFSRNFISLPSQAILMLPENISNEINIDNNNSI